MQLSCLQKVHDDFLTIGIKLGKGLQFVLLQFPYVEIKQTCDFIASSKPCHRSTVQLGGTFRHKLKDVYVLSLGFRKVQPLTDSSLTFPWTLKWYIN